MRALLCHCRHHLEAEDDEALPYLLCSPEGTVRLTLPLALVAKVVALAAQEIVPRPVKDRNPPAAARSGTDEPGPLSSKVACSPLKRHRLPHVLPVTTRASTPVTVEEGHSIVVFVGHAAYGANLLPSLRPAQGE